MSLVHQALRKAEREKQRRAGSPPAPPAPRDNPSAAAAPQPVALPPARPATPAATPARSYRAAVPILVTVVAAVAVVAIVWVANRTGAFRSPVGSAPTPSQAAGPTASAVPAPAPGREAQPTVAAPAAAVPPETAAAPAAMMVPAGTGDAASFKLTGIMKDPDGRACAVVNGRVVYEKYYVDGATVKQIDRDRVTLLIGTRETVLRLY